MRLHLGNQQSFMDVGGCAFDASIIPTMPLDALPAEILSLLANGVDAAGRPILDPRCRFHLAQVSRRFVPASFVHRQRMPHVWRVTRARHWHGSRAEPLP
ncbi:hypothetical protein TW95_gp0724 [Pandoravirus inopinatum]|uniref:Uncharacterized protein n=1 Tax=Pandoravirus inopinatum TaxID=1605721 RepID=A0A0B5IXG9_9VIRU|nr:hypothetical protein TW95_gp0724 [Pandoravirus inopinatum]AJF97458.1 hypothetical protein [Pandoravirus inopinatum]